MAEQFDHDVVNNTESASASAPADVAANQSTTVPAGNGTTVPAGNGNTDAQPTTDSLAESKDAIQLATDANAHALLEVPDNDAKELANGVHETGSQTGSQAGDASVEPSVTSDTEGGRADGSDQKKEGESHHVRSNSVKKPLTFSKVSATKNFLAKAASPTPTAAAAPKLGDKPSPLNAPVQPAAARPRLVAKTASSLQGMQRPRVAEGVGAPDASKVWNKNRPVAPPPPKQFTDEELKQQYGIHLATRLQSDENGKESKWADIDEDEEDWAPEAVVWMDGTKSALTPSETTPAPTDQQPAPMQAVKPPEGPKPTLAVKKPVDSGPPKTILKPGIAAQQAKQASQSAAMSAAADKPSLKAKSPAPPPSKSPWAVLPPVESTSPVNPPVQLSTHPAALPSQDARAYDEQPQSQPARQIAADTFDRSWREGEGAPRELFNSANGRYEPAPEGRRTSIRPDTSFRKPALLQRPSQQGQGPAEPSPAFQTRSNSQTDGPPSWGRRRGSSVSQASGPAGRRMSVSRPSDLPPAPEDESAVIGSDMQPSPASARAEPARPSFAQQSAWDQQMPPKPEAGAEPAEDPVKVQERIMREKREEARKRRKEDEERMEVEKQERLKAKLAGLGVAGKSRKEREAEAAAAAAAKSPAEKPSEPSAPAIKAEERPAVPTKPAEISAEVSAALEDKSLPPAPVQPQAAEEKLPSPLPAKPAQPASLPERPLGIDDASRQAPRAHLSPRAHARAPFSQQSSPYRPAASAYSSPGDRKQQPFGRSPLAGNDTFSGWNTTAPNGSVWGTSGIGNGTFEKASSFAPVPMSQHNSTLPPPPGMSRPANANRISPQGFNQDARSPSLQQQQLSEQQRAFPPPGIDARPENTWGTSRNAGSSPAPGLTRQPHAPGPIAPPSRAQLQQHAAQRPDAVSSWNNAAARLPHQYSADADAAARKSQEPIVAPPRDDTIKETFKKTSVDQGRLGGPRRFDTTEYTVHDGHGSRSVSALSPAPPSTQTQPNGPIPTSSPLNEQRKPVVENTVRIPDGSLNPAHGGLAQQPPIAPPTVPQQPLTAYQDNVSFPAGPLPGIPAAPTKDQSPPPPETDGHPAFSGDASHPNIKLPPPPPRVRLPPTVLQGPPDAQSQQQQQTAVTMPRRHQTPGWGPPGASRPLVHSDEWQARFNGLFNRTSMQTEVPPSPPKTPPKMQDTALAITSSTRAAMDDTPAEVATVSLPASPPRKNVTTEGFTVDDSADTASKPAIDQMFNEELGFGSRPTVRVPRHPAYEADIHSKPAYSLLRSPPTIKVSQPPTEVQSEPMLPLSWWPKNVQGIFVRIPGTKLQNSNRLVRYAVPAGKKTMSGMPKNFGERKGSGQVSNKGKEGKGGSAKGSGSNTPTPTPNSATTPNAGSRQASFQKPAAPSPAVVAGTPSAGSRQASFQEAAAPAMPATAAGSSPAPPSTSIANTSPAAANADGAGRRRGPWPRGPRDRGAPAAKAG